MPAIRGHTETNYISELMLSISFVMFNFNSSTIFQHLNQGSPRYLAPGGANSENFKNSGGEVNSSDLMDNLWRSPHNFVKKFFFFNKNHDFLKIFAEILLKSQKGN